MQTIISLKEVPSKIVDPRNKSGLRHPLLFILLLTLCAFMCGIISYTGVSEWGRALPQDFIEKLGFTRTPPCAATFCNVYCELDVDHLEKFFQNGPIWLWVERHARGHHQKRPYL